MKSRFAKISDLAGAAGKLSKPMSWGKMLAVAREDRLLTLEQTFGSVRPKMRPLDFRGLRHSVREAKAAKTSQLLKHSNKIVKETK